MRTEKTIITLINANGAARASGYRRIQNLDSTATLERERLVADLRKRELEMTSLYEELRAVRAGEWRAKPVMREKRTLADLVRQPAKASAVDQVRQRRADNRHRSFALNALARRAAA